MNSGLWQLTGDSTVNNLTARNSRVQSEEKGALPLSPDGGHLY
ncbi:hypothetical protein [Citrobacter amalonaticus]